MTRSDSVHRLLSLRGALQQIAVAADSEAPSYADAIRRIRDAASEEVRRLGHRPAETIAAAGPTERA